MALTRFGLDQLNKGRAILGKEPLLGVTPVDVAMARGNHRARIKKLEQAHQKRVAIDRRLIQAGRERPDKCECCGRTRAKLVYDHCHTSGDFRGWICGNCNTILGMAKDSRSVLASCIRYLKAHGK